MKVKSDKEVDIRTFEPCRRNNNFKGVLNPGFEIEVEEVNGQDIDGNNKWYKDKNGDYYWSGGFEKRVNSTLNIGTNKKKNLIGSAIEYDVSLFYDIDNEMLLKDINLNELLDIDSSIKSNKGESINIVIMDHPFPNISNIFQGRKTNAIDGGVVQAYHGLQMASLIGALDDIDSPRYISICPKCNLISLPIAINGDKDNQFFVDAIDKIIELYDPHNVVINASFSIKSQDIPFLTPHFERLSENYIVIASAGENTQLLHDGNIQYPASLGNVISVGTISDTFIQENITPAFHEKLDIIMPEFIYPAFNYDPPQKYKSVRGDSSATAIISGIVAMLLRKHGSLSKTQILELIIEQSLNYSELKVINSIKPIKP